MTKPYTIRMFLPSGNPSHIKILDKMNWTGTALEVSRSSWNAQRPRKEFGESGIYILIGYQEAEDLPTLYIGQSDEIRARIDFHENNKDFWERAIVFISNNHSLNRAHITWLEWKLINQATSIGRCKLYNQQTPNEPGLIESEKADTEFFYQEILSILPILDLRVFQYPIKISPTQTPPATPDTLDTIIVPAQEEGFQQVFLGENSWYAIRIRAGRIKDIRYIAAYRTSPVSSITHYAEVKSIEPYGDGGKYKVNFTSAANKINPIPFGDAKQGTMQGPRYTSFTRLKAAKNLSDLLGKT